MGRYDTRLGNKLLFSKDSCIMITRNLLALGALRMAPWKRFFTWLEEQDQGSFGPHAGPGALKSTVYTLYL